MLEGGPQPALNGANAIGRRLAADPDQEIEHDRHRSAS